MGPVFGVLALQGAFRAHVERLTAVGATAREVRTPEHLATVDALVMPGGESTSMSNLLTSSGLYQPIAARIARGMPVFGTCAGMILLAEKILDGRDDQQHRGGEPPGETTPCASAFVSAAELAEQAKHELDRSSRLDPLVRSFHVLDITVRRNGYGRQINSFETDVAIDGLDAPFHGVFIRAPKVEAVGPDVDVLAVSDGDPVLVRHGRILAASFHPELTNDTRLHELFASLVHNQEN